MVWYCLFPLVLPRALLESEILAYERTVQAAWSYCDWIRSQVEAGNDPQVRPEYGRRYCTLYGL
jgi:hypothetical protein